MERAIETAGGLRRFAQNAGLSATFVSAVRHGQSPGPKLAAYLGYRDDGKKWVRDGGK